MSYNMQLIMWTVALVALVAVEAATAQLVTIWFAAGALCALIAAALHAPLWLQCAIAIVVSVAALVITRPLIKKYTKPKIQPTNADRCIGQKAIVVEDIDNLAGKGLVSVNGINWTARSTDGAEFKKDDFVTVDHIEGVKLIVRALQAETPAEVPAVK